MHCKVEVPLEKAITGGMPIRSATAAAMAAGRYAAKMLSLLIYVDSLSSQRSLSLTAVSM